MDDRTTRQLNLVFVVCHPDDEALWVGGILCEVARFGCVRTHVVSLSGRDDRSPRAREFEHARQVAGYASGVVLGFPLRPAGEALPPVAPTLEEGLHRLCLSLDAVDLLVTHSPYGDEHGHPHHWQAHRELRVWTRERNIPFGYFSCLPMSDFAHVPVTCGFRRSGALHLLNRSRCAWPGGQSRRDVDCPAEYVQFGIDARRKREMLHCYQSIDLDKHERGYAAFTSGAEGFYVVDSRGSRVVDAIIDSMATPGIENLRAQHQPASPTLSQRVARRLRARVGF